MKTLRLIIIFYLINVTCLFSQKFSNDELEQYAFIKSEIANAKNDTTVVKALTYKGELFYEKFPDSVITICNEVIALADRKIKSANEQERRVYLLYKASATSNKAYMYEDYGDIIKAIECYMEALKIQEQIKDLEGVANTYLNLGVVYSNQDNKEKAFEFYNKAYAIQLKINYKIGAAYSLNNIGNFYEEKNDYNKALEYYFKSLKLNEEVGSKKGIALALHNIGANYFWLHQYDKAEDYYNKSLKIREEIGERSALCTSYENFAKLYLDLNQFDKAVEFGLKSLALAKEIKFPDVTVGSAQLLYKVYKKMGKMDKALSMHELYTSIKDSLKNDGTKKALIKSQFKYEYEKKALADSVKTMEEKKVINAQLETEKTKNYALYGGLFFVLIFTLFVFNRFKVSQRQKLIIQNQKHIVEEKHKEITDSINYAERIQRSFLSTKSLLDENLKDYFVFFKPKDIVSGDFYWGSTLSNGNFAFVTADSTGHGVPGAIMSLLNITSLEAVINDGNIEPSSILNLTRAKIIERLKKDGTEEGGKDGMDASLTIYDFKNKKLFFSAANNPVWIVRGAEIIELKADKMPIGKHERQNNSFTQIEIAIQKGDVIYSLTDGFPDQFGGEKGKKFMSKKLRQLLLENAHLPMNEQKDLLEKTFLNWIGDLEQVDDVTVIGVRI
jgi:serine phosphatase RsbU (regulator of sigma subunit)